MSLSFPETTRSQAHSAGSPHFTSQSPLTFQNPGRLRGFAGSALSWHLAASSLPDSGCFFPDYIFSLLPVSLRGPGDWSLGAARLSLQCVRRCRHACLGAGFLFFWSFSLPVFEDGCLSSLGGGPMALFLNFAFPFFSVPSGTPFMCLLGPLVSPHVSYLSFMLSS